LLPKTPCARGSAPAENEQPLGAICRVRHALDQRALLAHPGRPGSAASNDPNPPFAMFCRLLNRCSLRAVKSISRSQWNGGFRPDFVLEWVKADALPGFRRLEEALSK
jgi:hypothetical protein